jgi:hypothetical protein
MTPTVLALLLAAAPPPCDPNVDSSIERMRITLDRLEHSLDDVNGRALRKRMRAQIRDVRRALQHVRDEVCVPAHDAPPPPPVVVVPPPPRGPVLIPPLDAPSFRALQSAMKAEAFADGKRDVLEAALSGQCVTTAQARWIINDFSFDRDKLTAARLAIPRIVDRANAFKLISVFNFGREKKAVKQILKQPAVESCWAG